jgi:hypothetical protein
MLRRLAPHGQRASTWVHEGLRYPLPVDSSKFCLVREESTS